MSAGLLAAIFLGPTSRSIGTIVPDVVVEEAHTDALILTQHPVEKGAAITDHAFAQPSTVVIRCGFSDSTAGAPGYARAVYQEFLSWRQGRDPRDVFTGKRAYRNMLPANISVITDDHTEHVLALTIACQEVIIVSTQTTGTGTDTAGVGNMGLTEGGEKSAQPVGAQAFLGALTPGNYDASSGGLLGSPGFGIEVPGLSNTNPIPFLPDTGDHEGQVEVGPITIESAR